MGEPSTLSPNRLEEIMVALRRYAPVHKRRLHRWLTDTARLAFAAGSGTATEDGRELFFVRLGGIVHDLRKRFDGDLRVEDQLPGERTKSSRAFRSALKAVRDALSEDELLYIELRRHEACHPILNGYRAKVSDSEHWNSRKSQFLDGSELGIAEVLARCDKYESEAGSPDIVTQNLGRKTLSALRAAVHAFDDMASQGPT